MSDPKPVRMRTDTAHFYCHVYADMTNILMRSKGISAGGVMVQERVNKFMHTTWAQSRMPPGHATVKLSTRNCSWEIETALWDMSWEEDIGQAYRKEVIYRRRNHNLVVRSADHIGVIFEVIGAAANAAEDLIAVPPQAVKLAALVTAEYVPKRLYLDTAYEVSWLAHRNSSPRYPLFHTAASAMEDHIL